MDRILIFVAIATSVTLATNELKKIWTMIKRIIKAKKESKSILNEIKLGLLIAQGLGIWAIFSYKFGLLSTLGLEYPNIYFQNFDLFTTSLLASGGAALINQWKEIIQENNKPTK